MDVWAWLHLAGFGFCSEEKRKMKQKENIERNTVEYERETERKGALSEGDCTADL